MPKWHFDTLAWNDSKNHLRLSQSIYIATSYIKD